MQNLGCYTRLVVLCALYSLYLSVTMFTHARRMHWQLAVCVAQLWSSIKRGLYAALWQRITLVCCNAGSARAQHLIAEMLINKSARAQLAMSPCVHPIIGLGQTAEVCVASTVPI